MLLGWQAIVGLSAGTCTTVSLIPQVVLVVRTRSTTGLSPTTYAIHALGTSIWIAYGVIKSDPIIIGFHCVSFLLSCVVGWFFCKAGLALPVAKPTVGETPTTPVFDKIFGDQGLILL